MLITVQIEVAEDDAESVVFALEQVAEDIACAGYTDGETLTARQLDGPAARYCVWQGRPGDNLGERA